MMNNTPQPERTVPAYRTESAASVNGTLQDVAAFFQCSDRTVRRWCQGKNRLGHWKQAGLIVFGEDDVVSWWLRFHRDGQALKPGAGEAAARELWRQHVRVRKETAVRNEVLERTLDLERRVGLLANQVLRLTGGGQEARAA